MIQRPFLGAVLVGGRSSRMGRDKALIEIGGVTMVERAAALMREAGCCDVVAIGPRRVSATVPNVEDIYPGEGPLGGIITAIAAAASAEADGVLAIGCDLPQLDAVTLGSLLEVAAGVIESYPPSARVVIAKALRLEPLCAVWSIGSSAVLQRHFDSGQRAVHRVLTDVTLTAVDVAAETVRNVNTPEELQTE